MSDIPTAVYDTEIPDAELFGALPDLDFGDIETPAYKPPDPWDVVFSRGVVRDGYGRPLIKPDPAWELPPGEWPDGARVRGQLADGSRPYVRCSSIAERNDPAFGLGLWKQRHAALAIARRPDLQALLCGLRYSDGKAIDSVLEEAMIRAKDDGVAGEAWDDKLQASNFGTAIHAFTAPATGARRPVIHETWGPSLAQYRVTADAMASTFERLGLEEVAHEGFGISHLHQVAGTFDHLVRLTRDLPGPGGEVMPAGVVLVADVKSGKLNPVSHITQLEGYASLCRYDPATGETARLDPELSHRWGLLIGVDLRDGGVKVLPCDLTKGYLGRAVASHRASLATATKALIGSAL